MPVFDFKNRCLTCVIKKCGLDDSKLQHFLNNNNNKYLTEKLNVK